MATITVRRLDANWEPQYGEGQNNFISDVDAVAQIIAQRLKLLQDEWWEDKSLGVPLWQSIAGFAGQGNNPNAISLILQAQILKVPFVTAIRNMQASYDPNTRNFTFAAVVDTQFGSIAVSNQPTVPSQALPS